MKYITFKDGGILWSPYKLGDSVEYHYYFYPIPNWLDKKYRYFGYYKMYYDGYHYSFGFWYFNISWNVGWTDVEDWLTRS